MRVRQGRTATGLALAATLACGGTWAQDVGPDAPTATGVETLASFPHGAFLENLIVRPDGSVLFTSYFAETVELLDPARPGAVTTFAAPDAHPVGIVDLGGAVVISAHGASFADGPAFTSTNRFVVLASDGSVVSMVPAPGALFLNGLAALGPDLVLAADSLSGTIWAFEPSTGLVTPWLVDPVLAPAPEVANGLGANGLKLDDDALLVSNTSRQQILRVPLDGMSPAGPPEVIASLPVDDFALLPDGSLVAATHGAQLLRLAGGEVTEVMAEGCDGCTSVARLDPSGDLVVLTTGNLVAGGDEPARVLRLSAAPPN